MPEGPVDLIVHRRRGHPVLGHLRLEDRAGRIVRRQRDHLVHGRQMPEGRADRTVHLRRDRLVRGHQMQEGRADLAVHLEPGRPGLGRQMQEDQAGLAVRPGIVHQATAHRIGVRRHGARHISDHLMSAHHILPGAAITGIRVGAGTIRHFLPGRRSHLLQRCQTMELVVRKFGTRAKQSLCVMA